MAAGPASVAELFRFDASFGICLCESPGPGCIRGLVERGRRAEDASTALNKPATEEKKGESIHSVLRPCCCGTAPPFFCFVLVFERLQILIQRDEESRDKHPVLFYKKFPPKIASMQVTC